MIWWAPPLSLRGYLGLRAALVALWGAVLVAGLVAGYRRADALERRQLRWLVYGLHVGFTPMLAAFALHAIGIPGDWQQIAYAVGAVGLAAVPIGLLVSVIWFDLLDVDRLISATTWYTLLALARPRRGRRTRHPHAAPAPRAPALRGPRRTGARDRRAAKGARSPRPRAGAGRAGG